MHAHISSIRVFTLSSDNFIKRLSQERIIRFSLQHNFVVKHPYENMVSFVTRVKRIGKTIFFYGCVCFLGILFIQNK